MNHKTEIKGNADKKTNDNINIVQIVFLLLNNDILENTNSTKHREYATPTPCNGILYIKEDRLLYFNMK